MSERFEQRPGHGADSVSGDDAARAARLSDTRAATLAASGKGARWSTAAKAGIVAESFAAGAVVAEVARRHGIWPQQLSSWRREARDAGPAIGARPIAPGPARREPAGGSTPPTSPARPEPRAPAFAAVMLAASPPAPEPSSPTIVASGLEPSATALASRAEVATAKPGGAPAARPARTTHPAGAIEIAIGDAIVRLGGRFEPETLGPTLTAVPRAVRAAP